MKPPARHWVLLAALGGLGVVALPAQPALREAAQEPAIELPTYTVTDSRELPPPVKWLYGRIEGFEILSNASEKSTQGLVRNLQRFAFALDLVWPISHRQSTVPVSLIICGRGGKFDVFKPAERTEADLAMASIQLMGGF